MVNRPEARVWPFIGSPGCGQEISVSEKEHFCHLSKFDNKVTSCVKSVSGRCQCSVTSFFLFSLSFPFFLSLFPFHCVFFLVLFLFLILWYIACVSKNGIFLFLVSSRRVLLVTPVYLSPFFHDSIFSLFSFWTLFCLLSSFLSQNQNWKKIQKSVPIDGILIIIFPFTYLDTKECQVTRCWHLNKWKKRIQSIWTCFDKKSKLVIQMAILYYPVIFCNHQKKKRKNFASYLLLSFVVLSFDLVLHHLFPGLDHPFPVKNIEQLWKRKKEREKKKNDWEEKGEWAEKVWNGKGRILMIFFQPGVEKVDFLRFFFHLGEYFFFNFKNNFLPSTFFLSFTIFLSLSLFLSTLEFKKRGKFRVNKCSTPISCHLAFLTRERKEKRAVKK